MRQRKQPKYQDRRARAMLKAKARRDWGTLETLQFGYEPSPEAQRVAYKMRIMRMCE